MVGFYYEMLAEKERLEKDVRKFTRLLEGMPEGELRVHKDGKRYRYYRKILIAGNGKSHNGKREVIRSSNTELIETLAKKGFYEHYIKDAKREIGAIDKYLQNHDKSDGWLYRYLNHNVGIKNILARFFNVEKDSLLAWEMCDYVKYSGYPEQLNVPTMANHMVRSKSEGLIVNALFMNKIPYHYEEEFELKDGSIIYPDFIIRHPVTGKIYIWEHLGRIDEEDYLVKNLGKIKQYIESGFIPTVNLIITYETKNSPVDVRYINEMVTYYFGGKEISSCI